MPELPEVECVRRTLTPSVLGRTILRTRVDLAKLARPSPALFRSGLAGRTIIRTRRHGKLLLLLLDDASFWAVHLGMTGQLIMSRERPKAKHLHITVSFKDGGERLYFRDMRQFGYMAYCRDEEALIKGPLANFGPDALRIGADEFVNAFQNRKAPIKSLLLDQRILAGVGNIYADESLHRAGISPLARPHQLSREKLLNLHMIVREILLEALKRGGSSVRNFVDAKGRAGTFQHAHFVYRRTGEACPNCGGTILRTVVGGRSTHYCPDCQKGGC